MHNQKGFSLIEILMTVAITLILATASTSIYGNLQVSTQLNESVALIVQAIRTARERSIAGLNNASHGVCFESNRYILYQGPSCALRDQAYDLATNLESALSLSTTLENGDVVFSKGTGIPNVTGIDTVTVIYSVNDVRVIQINSAGVVKSL